MKSVKNDACNENSPAVVLQDVHAEIPSEVLSNPVLLFLYYRIEQILGIKAGSEALTKLNAHIEKSCNTTFLENPAVYDLQLSSRENIFEISKYLTVNETYFFREEVHFSLLEELLPVLSLLNRPLKICSAATSNGCEAYSIAMFLDYKIKNGYSNLDFTIDAFDVNSHVINIAKKARYTANTIRTDGSSWKHIIETYLKYDNSEYTVSCDIKNKVNFFTHNVMRGFDRQYDIIFFRNALIYFSFKNRLSVLNNIAEALSNNGFLFLGISETSSVNHPMLASRYSSGTFYFQKITGASTIVPMQKTSGNMEDKSADLSSKNNDNTKNKKLNISLEIRRKEFSIEPGEIASILETFESIEGKSKADMIMEMLLEKAAGSLTGSAFAACALYFLTIQDFKSAEIALSKLENNNTCAFTRFLCAEYLFLQDKFAESEQLYQEASVKNKKFWPAFYRLAVIAQLKQNTETGDRMRYEYKINKAIESIEAGKELKYECFMGGFSSDYFLRILKKKLTQ